MSHTEDIFNDLAGNWSIERTIEPGGRFIGQAQFIPEGKSSLTYREEGVLTLDDGTVLNPTKKYEWRLEQGAIAIYFADGVSNGKIFHRIVPDTEGKAIADHHCSPDFYKSSYHFNMPDQFHIVHDVEGPKKKYASITVYLHIE